MPNLLDRRDDPESAWALFADSGKWNLGSLPENEGLAQRAGEILRSVHESGAEVSNLTRGIDADWVATDFTSALRRLQRYRGKLRLPGDLFVRARSVAPPPATEPKVSHAHLSAERVVVDDGGAVTLIGWEWATLAPPEWDLSRAAWLIGTRVGERAAIAFQEGYGRTLVPAELERWTVYHTAMLLLFRADDSLRSGSGADLDYLISELHRSVAAAAS
jgi:aminoglycoside phosphotransferase (APT) family kinase protein